MRSRTLLLAIGLVIATSLPAYARSTLYVSPSPTGDDSRTYVQAQNPLTPWATIGRAAWGSTNRAIPNAGQAAQAGDTVMITSATYNFAGVVDNRFDAVYNPVNQGTSSVNRITFQATGPVTLTAPATQSPVIGCNVKNHIVWKGPFSLNEASISIHPDTGTVVMTGATGCGVDGISVDGDGDPGYVDNHNGVRIEFCTGCFVRNSTIFDVNLPSNPNHNQAGIMLYDSDDTIIEHNYITDVDTAIFVKGVHGLTSQAGTIIRYNLLVDCGDCVIISFSENARVYQNVIRDSGFGIYLLAEGVDPFRHPVGDWMFNNTIDGMSKACVNGQGSWHENVRVWNNIMTNCAWANYFNGNFNSSGAVIDWEHNNYFANNRVAGDNSGNRTTLAQWTAAFTHDLAAPAAIDTDPRYADAVSNDFRLCTGAGAPLAGCVGASAARTLGVDLYDLDTDGSTIDIIPAGAYITNNEVIGPNFGAIQAPTNLRITQTP